MKMPQDNQTLDVDSFMKQRQSAPKVDVDSFMSSRKTAPAGGGTPITDHSTIGPDKSNVFKSAALDPFKVTDLTKPIENYTEQGRKEHPVLSRVGDVTRGAKELMFGGQEVGKPMGTSSGVMNNPVTMAMGATDLAGMAGSLESRLAAKSAAQELIKINKTLGVGPKQVNVGRAPSSLNDFIQNPARVMQKAGVDAKTLAKMDPIQRLQKVDDMRQATGQQLDAVLKASQKTVDVQNAFHDTLDMLDGPLRKQAVTKLNGILEKNGVQSIEQLKTLTPIQARTIQRGLDDFASFAPPGEQKNFADIATALRRKISRATVDVVPEAKQLDQDYTDLMGASKAASNQVNKYSRTVPKTTMQKIKPYAIGAAGTAIAGGLGLEARHLLP